MTLRNRGVFRQDAMGRVHDNGVEDGEDQRLVHEVQGHHGQKGDDGDLHAGGLARTKGRRVPFGKELIPRRRMAARAATLSIGMRRWIF